MFDFACNGRRSAAVRRRLVQFRPGGKGPTTPTLIGPKYLQLAVKVLYFQNFGRTNDCLVETFLK